jgi:hypothetical protein
LVALAIGDFMNTNGEAWPSLSTIAAWTGINRVTVVEIVLRLCGDGPKALFERRPGGSPMGGRRLSATYRLRSTQLVAQDDQSPRATSRPGLPDWSPTATGLVAQGYLTGSPGHHRRDHEGTIEGMMKGARAREESATRGARETRGSIEDSLPDLIDRFAAWHVGLGTDELPGVTITRWPGSHGIPEGTRLKVLHQSPAAIARVKAREAGAA